VDASQLHLATVVSAPFEENTYIAHLDGRKDCLIVDPGLEPAEIIDYVEKHGLTPAAVLITHAHADHIAGNGAMKRRWPACPIVIGRSEAPKLTDAQLNLSARYGLPMVSPPADILLDPEQSYSAAGFDLEVRTIPGHSTGHIVFIWTAGDPAVVFGGDVLFAGSIGRTDFPDGSFEQLARGIHAHLFTLADDTVVLSGHGPATTIGEEKASNPFVGRPAGWRDE
jgi:hydroxyacylglutathione hydrolase